ncbi:MAG: hypothetical protein IJZ03_01200 [Clostridia bacterium]|nr:hypothetical protein [Clostridia bacterium]
MKKYFALLLIVSCIVGLFSCGEKNGKSDDADDDRNDIITQAYFCGRVIEINGNSCLMEVTDTGNQSFNIGDPVVVNTDVGGCPEYGVGDLLRIVFDGTVAESYPMQIFGVVAVYRIDSEGKTV